jgi:hypothetical protein
MTINTRSADSPFYTQSDRIQYRARFCRLVRRAYDFYLMSMVNRIDCICDPCALPCEKDRAVKMAEHYTERYNRLLAALATEAGVSENKAHFAVAVHWPICPALVENL